MVLMAPTQLSSPGGGGHTRQASPEPTRLALVGLLTTSITSS